MLSLYLLFVAQAVAAAVQHLQGLVVLLAQVAAQAAQARQAASADRAQPTRVVAAADTVMGVEAQHSPAGAAALEVVVVVQAMG